LRSSKTDTDRFYRKPKEIRQLFFDREEFHYAEELEATRLAVAFLEQYNPLQIRSIDRRKDFEDALAGASMSAENGKKRLELETGDELHYQVIKLKNQRYLEVLNTVIEEIRLQML
ncbi:MAG: hypothetical protein KDD76_06715, partial [Rickettsiales bacterium]|nr:hypothetical protein [Rickettsiales bacterium]